MAQVPCTALMHLAGLRPVAAVDKDPVRAQEFQTAFGFTRMAGPDPRAGGRVGRRDVRGRARPERREEPGRNRRSRRRAVGRQGIRPERCKGGIVCVSPEDKQCHQPLFAFPETQCRDPRQLAWRVDMTDWAARVGPPAVRGRRG